MSFSAARLTSTEKWVNEEAFLFLLFSCADYLLQKHYQAILAGLRQKQTSIR